MHKIILFWFLFINSGRDNDKKRVNFQKWRMMELRMFGPKLLLTPHCVTQLKLYTGYKLSSTIFCCLWVCEASVSPDQISTFSNIYRHTSPMLTLYHVIPSSASFYWPSTTKYQTVSPYTDPVPAGTTYNSSFRKAQLNNFSFYDSFDESRTVYLV